MRRILLSSAILVLFTCSVWAASDDDGYAGLTPERVRQTQTALDNLKQDYTHLRTYQSGPMITRLYGVKFGFGYSPEATADQFRLSHAGIFGVESRNLIPGNLMSDRRLTQPVMYNAETGAYKFTLVYYRQEVEGIPVYQSELRLLVRNDYDYPLVLAVSSLRNLGDFVPDKSYLGGYSTTAEQAARTAEPDLTDFSEQEVVIWAGVDSKRESPRMAVVFDGTSDFPQDFRFVVDPTSGEILYKEDRIIFEDVVGNVSGMASEGLASENCEEEVLEGMPFARVNIGSTVAYTDSLGDFVIPNSGTDPVTVTSEMRGEWFAVSNYAGSVENLSRSVLPPGPANFTHNNANTNVLVRAQVNAYNESNKVRSMAVAQNPAYPNLMVNEFPISVNRTDGYCPGNAWYSPSEQSINFCQAGGQYPNTAWSAVVHHEYGHHLINMGGSGQGQYGEGMGDCIYVVIEDSPDMGLGFFGPCAQPLRNADNSHQYPCSGGIHDCGQLLSGCVWDTRNALAVTTSGPEEYLPILRNLTVNSILLHTGTEITPQITIDWLTLDDNDGNIDNGTPHYWEIAAGFGLHNMDAPELAPLSFAYPLGTPSLLAPGAPTSFTVVISGVEGESPVAGTGQLHYRVEGGSLTSVNMTEVSDNNYVATLPPVDCLEEVHYYVSAEASGIGIIYDPNPSTPRKAFAATDEIVLFEDDFETDQGWTSSGGDWARGTPTGNGGAWGQPDPSSGHSGTSVFGYNLNGDYTDNMSEYHLTSPALDCSELAKVQLNFWRWLGVEQDAYDHARIRVSSNGSDWELVWENTSTIDGGSWVEQTFDISSVADGEATVYVRFSMGTTDVGWHWCGWNIDDVVVTGYECNPNGPSIVTTVLPEWTEGIPYSHAIEATGGTAPYVWSDMNGDLVGTGLSLSTNGLLSGTPNGPGVINFTVEVVDDSAYADAVFLSLPINDAVRITSSSLPDRTAGVAYSQQLIATGGTGGLGWTDLNNDLNGTGLTLSATGLVSGAPTAQTVSFTAMASDNVGAFDNSTFSFTINPELVITTPSLANGNLDEPYAEQLAASGGTGPHLWIDKNNDLDGTGLNLGSDGDLTGTPNASGILSFTARVIDGGGGEDEQLFSFEIIHALSITTTEIPDWTQNYPLSQIFGTDGGYGVQTWSDKNGDLAGTGLSVTPGGVLSGTPVSTGAVSFVAQVVDSLFTVEQQFDFTINPAVIITTEALPNGELGELYQGDIISSGGTGQRVMSDKNGDLIGTGLSIIPIGVVAGTPNATGVINFTAISTDAIGATFERVFSIVVTSGVTIITSELPEWTVNSAYSHQLEYAGGSGSAAWIDKNGDLAGTGLNLDSDGLLSGIPVAAGGIVFIAEITDDSGTDEQQLSLTINPAIGIVTTSLPDWTIGFAYSQQFDATGGTGQITFGDNSGDLVGTGLSVSATGLLSGTPAAVGPISFTLAATDEAAAETLQPFTFTINDVVSISTSTISDGMEGVPYSFQLEAADGTGAKTWSEGDSGLNGTGLSLSSDGLLSGTVGSMQTINFTAAVVDAVGSSDDQAFTFAITAGWFCGDIDGSGSPDIDIADLVFLVDYMFNGGPEPPVLAAADVDGSGEIDIADLVYLVDFMFTGGPAPICQ